MRPVEVDGQILVDGGATNPLPFELCRGRPMWWWRWKFRAGRGPPARGAERLRCLYATVLVMTHSMSARSFATARPICLCSPRSARFRALGFLQASAILRAADHVKLSLKEKLAKLLNA